MSSDVLAFSRRFALLLGVLAITAIAPARAQDAAPPTPMDPAPATTGIMDAAGAPAPAEAPAAAPTPAAAESAMDAGWELCPEPMDALSQVPGQLEELQADIDRYTLCLNRAELLMKLEDLKNQNREKQMAGPGGPGTLPSLSPPPLNTAQTQELLGADATAEDAPPPAAAPVPQDGYTIKEVRGAGNALTARLVTPSGTVEQVQQGDRLDDGSEVTSVSATQVIITKDGKTDRLSWAN